MLSRLKLVLALIFSLFTIFTGRLIFLQIVSAKDLLLQSQENISEKRRVSPLRGRILARDGTILADNRIASDLMYKGGEIKHWDKLRYLLKLNSEPTQPDLSDPLQRKLGFALAENISDDLVPAIEELVAGQSNLYLHRRLERVYPTSLAAQVVGYTKESLGRYASYALDDLVGEAGIESSFQTTLFGQVGRRDVRVDNRGVDLETVQYKEAKPGQDIILTIDPQIQKLAEDVLENGLQYVNQRRLESEKDFEEVLRGAIVVLNPNNGEILAMASNPSYDQNIFTKRPNDIKKVSELLTDTKHMPLQNRAVQAYPPASTFKLITSSTLLERGYISPSQKYFCSAFLKFGGITWENWSYPASRGNYDVTEAIGDSCNTFFWYAAIDTPDFKQGWAPYIQDLTDRAFEFGYGSRLNIGLGEEKSGRIPTEKWKRDYFNEPWYPGDSLNTSIGQGNVLATPVQVAQLIETIALDGQQFKPHIVKAIGNEPKPIESKQIAGKFWSTLKIGMRKMITDHGASRLLGPAAKFPIEVAGKTGTAQNQRGDGYDHAWFAGFAPLVNPEIVFVVFIEYGDNSSKVAVPMARDFFKAYFGVEE